jgi:hypothetical protein
LARTHFWRRVRCAGCRYRCRYRDFRVWSRAAFAEVREALWVDSEDSKDWKYKSRGVILGIMHVQKRDAWEYATDRCPNNGTGDDPPHDKLC